MYVKITVHDEYFKLHKERTVEKLKDWYEIRNFINGHLKRLDGIEKNAAKGYIVPLEKKGKMRGPYKKEEKENPSTYDDQARAEGETL